MCLSVHLLPVEAGFQGCQLDMESLWLLRAILQVLAFLEELCVKALLQISASYFVVSEQFG